MILFIQISKYPPSGILIGVSGFALQDNPAVNSNNKLVNSVKR